MNPLSLVVWFQVVAGVIAFGGIFIGAISFFYPDHSIELYQLIMHILNWDVRPIDYQGEMRRTRIMGALIFLISVAIIVILFRPQLIAPAS